MFIVSSIVNMLIHCATMWAFDLSKKFSCRGLLKGGGRQKVFWNFLYLNDDTKLDSKILSTVLLHDIL